MASITVNGNTLQPLEHVSASAAASNFIYVKCSHDLSVPEKQQLAQKEAYIQEYVAQYTYMCRYEPKDLGPIRALTDFVVAANVYHPELKATVSLKDMVEHDDTREYYEVDVILHAQPNVNSAALAPFVADAAGIGLDNLEVTPRKIRLTVHQSNLDALAALDSVNRIEEVQEKVLYNDRAREILLINNLPSDSRYKGRGQTVCVADSGFDQGVAVDTPTIKVHPAFKDRILDLYSIWEGNNASDPVGHGTHVCGSICGAGIFGGGSGGDIVIDGTAPEAKLIVQALSTWSTTSKQWILKVPTDVIGLFSDAYKKGARIHNNSWGDRWTPDDGQKGYEDEATAIDLFTCEHPDFVIVVAAGNDALAKNAGASQIGDNSAAKNCITVGAVGSTRINDGWKPVTGDSPSNIQSTKTALFSSRGPTKATKDAANQIQPGRIKPDIAAPGVAILSAASRMLADNNRMRAAYSRSGDRDWLYLAGTSMSTPLVSGCVAVLREALQEQHRSYPSAALIKALLINGAENYSAPKDNVFDYEQGFGRANMAASISMIEKSTFVVADNASESTSNDVAALTDDSSWESPAIPLSGRHTNLSVTLAYPDDIGALLQNNLNLIVRAGGIERHGNMGLAPGYDNTNNVEKVIWKDVPSDSFSIVVTVRRIAKLGALQSFAVAWHESTV